MVKMKFKVLDMSLNFLQSSVEYIKNNKSETELQFSIIHLTAMVELMLKACLINEHWSLIIENSDQINLSNFKSGDFKSINIDEAILRIGKICDFNISGKPKIKIDRLKKERNKIIHMGIGVNQHHAMALIIDTYNFVYDFAKEVNIFGNFPELEYKFNEIKNTINSFEEFIRKRLQNIKKELSCHDHALFCPECFQQAVIMSEDERECLFCRKIFSINEFKEMYIDFSFSLDDYYEEIVSQCPECGEDSVISIEEIGNPICLSCGLNIKNFVRCMDCGDFFKGDANYPICGDCAKNRFDNDQMLPAPNFPEDEY